ncbi:uncharacterized protein F13E9.13, mitochondrial-like isoform X2 [Centruroides sculpturatus]|nr:uncharacterized protein F13E9.13, mitochondrial-like isoform X2 [Centruroides sculpturatus]XP_023233016.1 uncharacterized protein F13E9.13, mitochondrial-like isoform X2 [Centruroides sculpturatus]XP_023233017.1 uncharacterized protein F13E9.13, mitochondrial-like isoform X2 [Centruroides sculpturatus]
MIHVRALPGTPKSKYTVQQLIDISCKEAEIYKKYNVDGILIENMHDIPYILPDRSGPEVTSVMTRICSEIKCLISDIPCGVQLLAGNNEAAMAVALAAGLQFIRVEGFVFGHLADEGFIQGCAGTLLRQRKIIGADNILVFTDIKKKHCSHAITSDLNTKDIAKAAEFFLSDGVILTGSTTGDPPCPNEVSDVLHSISIPVILGSGITINNIHLYNSCCGMIVGSHFKIGDNWSKAIEENKVAKFMDKVKNLRRI